MSVVFSGDRGLPPEFRNGGMGDGLTEGGAVNFMKAISPWDFLTGWLVTKPAAEAAAQADIARSQAAAMAANDALLQAKQKTLRTIAFAGAGVLAVLVLVMATKPRSAAVSGYRKSKSSRRRSRR